MAASFIPPLLLILLFISGYQQHQDMWEIQDPSVMIVILARNKEHTLPYFLNYLYYLDYPKHRISLWIRSDHNEDRTDEVLDAWADRVEGLYHSVDLAVNDTEETFDDQSNTFHWSSKRFRHVINLRENGLNAARRAWADYVWFLDCDVFLVNNQTLRNLISEDRILLAPMLESLGKYSNFWCGMNDKFYYQRTPEYTQILDRNKTGVFPVPMIHTSVLLDLRYSVSNHITFLPENIMVYSCPEDDIIAFALSAKIVGVPMYITNQDEYGYLMYPLEEHNDIQDDLNQLTSVKLEIMVKYPEIELLPALEPYVPNPPEPEKLGFDEVYMINLVRRPERRRRMMATFRELGINVKILNAVDGRELNDTVLEWMGIRFLPEYLDPYSRRPMTMGEVGCFLSHYKIWKEVVELKHRVVIVFEDDIHFETFFRSKLESLMSEISRIGLQWDLIYLGRKRLVNSHEPYVDGTTQIVHVDYSYWTLCYLLTFEGAQKLLRSNPLPKILPVDEYLPIMFDKHPNARWKAYFRERNLRAFSAYPLLVYPTHYTGEKDYFSDTEDSNVATNAKDEL